MPDNMGKPKTRRSRKKKQPDPAPPVPPSSSSLPPQPNPAFVPTWQALAGGNPGMIQDPRMFYFGQRDGGVVGFTPVLPGAFFYPNFSHPSIIAHDVCFVFYRNVVTMYILSFINRSKILFRKE